MVLILQLRGPRQVMEVKEETPEEAAQMADSGGEIVEPPVPAPAAAPAAAPATQEEMPGGWDERHRRSGLGQSIFFCMILEICNVVWCLMFYEWDHGRMGISGSDKEMVRAG